MKNMLRRIYNKVYPPIKFPDNGGLVQTYSQGGEDLIIDAILGFRQHGFYVDVGANDPVALNNTKRFYDRGWQGINIEPHPVKYSELCLQRPRDTNLWCGVSDTAGAGSFFIMNDPVLSTFDAGYADGVSLARNATILETRSLRLRRLDDIFNTYDLSAIDFMTVDAEGMDLSVLKSNDWARYRPNLVVVEITESTQSILDYMISVGYTPVLRNAENGFFINNNP